ncbi:MAG: methyltransferase domain-containing protein [Pseudomonadota bacterium]
MKLFDGHARIIRGNRINKLLSDPEIGAGFLIERAASGIADRLADVQRSFPDVAIIGSGGGAFAVALSGRADAGTTVQIEPSPDLAKAVANRVPDAVLRIASEEAPDLQGQSHDLVVGGLSLHRANDPVGVLTQMRLALRPDGLALVALFGGQTLQELRASFAEAEAEVEGGISPRVAPMAEIRDLGSLLQRAGFALPVADVDRMEVAYQTPFHLMRDLRAMGEANPMADRRRTFTRRATMMRMAEIYTENFSRPDGRVTATFEIVYLTGWAPADSQPQPLRPGSAKARLADALGTSEKPAGDKTPHARRDVPPDD